LRSSSGLAEEQEGGGAGRRADGEDQTAEGSALPNRGKRTVCFANSSLIACFLPPTHPSLKTQILQSRKLENFLFVVARFFNRVGFPPRHIWL